MTRSGHTLDAKRFRAAAITAGLDGIPLHVWRWEDLPVTGSYKVRRGVLRTRLCEQAAAATPAPIEPAPIEPAPIEVA